MNNNWKDVWGKRTVSDDFSDILSELICLDGFDGKTGKINVVDWVNYIKYISDYIGIKKHESIFEIGCGSGAFLYPFFLKGHIVQGIDYSESLVKNARKLWNAPIDCLEAIQVPVLPLFDIVISNSVFFYFPSLEYAEIVIQRMIEKSKHIIAILEVPDVTLYDTSEEMRRGEIGEEDYKIKYAGLEHLYYDKEWFIKIGEKYNLKTSIFNQHISHYKNNDYRFNCIFKKK